MSCILIWINFLLTNLWWFWFKIKHFVKRFFRNENDLHKLCSLDRQKSSFHVFNYIFNRNSYHRILSNILKPKVIYEISNNILYYSADLDGQRRQLETKDCDLMDVFNSIIEKRKFEEGSFEAKVLYLSLNRIHATFCLLGELNLRASTPFDHQKILHERKLNELYSLLLEEEKNEKNYNWGLLGFQGKDPATDFRSMGILCLDHLHYFAKKHKNIAKKICLECRDIEANGYNFALVGIHISSFLLDLLRTRRLLFILLQYCGDIHIDELEEEREKVSSLMKECICDLYCVLFVEFNKFWNEWVNKRKTRKENKIPLVMQFNSCFKEFKAIIDFRIFQLEEGIGEGIALRIIE